MKFLQNFPISLCLFTSLASFAAGQTPAQVPAIVSPDVHPDRTVTFRLCAPKASKVDIAGEWIIGNNAETTGTASIPMTRDEKGVWSITVGPLAANTYIYSFNMDGINMADPVNPAIKLRARTSASLVSVPGGEPWEFSDVPHGKVEINYHQSAALGGAMRQIFVYTPPGYDKNPSARYPVLYLLHGSLGMASDWTQCGFANYILDNLIAQKQAVPMIIVMPWGHATPYGEPVPKDPQQRNAAVYERYFISEVMPYVEANYRVAAGRGNRAIAGLSMGGGESIQIEMDHPELMAYFGVFSVNYEEGFAKWVNALLADPKKANDLLKVLFVSIGKDDPRYPHLKELGAVVTNGVLKGGRYYETNGAHVWPVWRESLVQYAPLLFK